MLGQLDWDGVVLPITEVSWANVIATADRLQGLDVNEDFFVTYKDEEGDVINVKNEVDLNEAIRWAQEQGVPCLCLQVPFTATESDSDESWTEIDNGSPRGATRKEDSEEVDESEQRSILQDDAVEDTASIQPPIQDQSSDDLIPSTKAEQEDPVLTEAYQETAANTVNEDEVSTVEDESVQDESVEDVVAGQVVDDPTRLSPVKVPVIEEPTQVVEHRSPVVQTVTPIEAVFEAEAVRVQQNSPPVLGGGNGIDKIIEIMCSVTDSYTADSEDREFFIELLADPASTDKVITFLAHPAIKTAISAVAQAARISPGNAMKAAKTQLIKVLYKSPEVLPLLSAIPQLEDVLGRVLRSLNAASTPLTQVSATSEEEEIPSEESSSKTVHTLVTCDGCGDDELRGLSMHKGLRNEQGEIRGIRYKSAVLPDFDLCESCEATGRFQAEAGPFLKIVDPGTAPEVILCAMPGATSGMLNQIENLDWRNPVAREFLEFVKSRQQRAFSQQRDRETPPTVGTISSAASTGSPTVPRVVAAEPPRRTFACKHLLKTFEAPHGGFSCDVCSKGQPVRTLLHGCRECNFDVCRTCYAENNMGLTLAPTPTVAGVSEPVTVAPAPSAPQAKFVCDVTLTDGCAVRAGERLTKTWRVRNSGQERWPSGTRICHVGGDSFSGPVNGVEVPLASPGEAVAVAVPLVMPQQPGRYTSYWRMVTPHPQSAKFGHRFWVTVNVLAATASLAPVPPPAPRPDQLGVSAPSAPPSNQLRGPPPPPPQFAPLMLPGSPPVLQRPSPPTVTAQRPFVTPSSFEETVARIADFGFMDVDKIVKVLGEVNGDAAAAIERLLEDA